MSADFIAQLQGRGYHPGQAVPFEEFANQLAEYFDIIAYEQVRELPQSSSVFHSSQAMSLHTDHRDADCVAWWCKQPAAAGGESLLLDAHALLAQMSEDEVRSLGDVLVRLPGQDEPVPLVSQDGARTVYYAPWLTQKTDDERAAGALARFENLIASAQPVHIQLRATQWLLIDNHRIMHGRSSFTPNTHRHLLRLWLRWQEQWAGILA